MLLEHLCSEYPTIIPFSLPFSFPLFFSQFFFFLCPCCSLNIIRPRHIRIPVLPIPSRHCPSLPRSTPPSPCRSSARRRRQTTNSDSIYSNYRDAQDLSGISFRILASRFRPSSALCQLPIRSLRFFPPSASLRFVAPSSDYHARAGISFRSN